MAFISVNNYLQKITWGNREKVKDENVVKIRFMYGTVLRTGA